MTMTRRGFLKLAAAGAAVAIVPAQVVEAIAPVPVPTTAADVAARRLWSIRQISWSESAARQLLVDLTLVAGSCHIELGMLVHEKSHPLWIDDEIEIDIRMVEGKLLPFIDDQPAVGVHRFIVGVERPMNHCVLDDWSVRSWPGEADIEPLKQLTAFKQLRGEK